MQKWLTLSIVLCLHALHVACASEMNLLVSLDRTDLQRRVEQLFPVSHRDGMLSVKVYGPEIILNDGSKRIGLRLRIMANGPERLSVSGSARVDGVLRYKRSSGEFYLDDASVEELRIDNVLPIVQDQIRLIAGITVTEILQDRPIYKLGQRGESKEILGSEVRSVSVRDGKLLIELAMP